jgi:amino acid adenylation domain-containing protein
MIACGDTASAPGDERDLPADSNLTRSQFLIWMGQKLHPDAPLYNMIQTFAFDSALDVSAFQRAFQGLIDSSDALRTVIEEIEGVPRRRVLPKLAYTVDLVDLSAESEPDVSYARWLEERRSRLADLGARLFDSVLVKLGAARFTWYLSQHHLITDGWSFLLVYRGTAELYRRALAGETDLRLDLPRFEAYAHHERIVRDAPAGLRARGYWEEKLAASTEPLALYGRSPRQATSRTERVACDLGVERTARLKSVAAEEGVRAFNQDLSIFNLLATIFLAYLHRVSGSSRLALGTPLHNRSMPTFKETIGVFIEIGVLRIEVAEDDTFSSLLQKVMSETFTVLGHALPGISRSENNRAYEVLLNFVNVDFPAFAGMQPLVEWVHAGHGDSNHALRLQVHDFNRTGSYRLLFDFNTEVFPAAQRTLAVEHFLRMVDACLENRDQPINRVGLLAAAETEQFVVNFNRTVCAYPVTKTIIALFEEQVARAPEAIAVRLGSELLTYAELNARANQLSHLLQACGAGPEVVVAVCMERSLEVIVALLGILKAGAAYAPLDPSHPTERLHAILAELAQAAPGRQPILLVQPQRAARFRSADANLVMLGSDWSVLEPYPRDNPSLEPAPDNLAYVIYTSGSTGRPKGVMIEQRSLVNYIWWAARQYCRGRASDFAFFTSLSFDLTVTSIFTPLLTGGCIVVYPEDEAARGMAVLKVVEDDTVDVVKLTPAHLALLRGVDFRHSRLKTLIVGGEEFKVGLARSISAAFDHQVDIYNEYGPTEATVGCMIHRYDPATDHLPVVPVGVPAANTQVYILDAQMNPVPTGVIGEMYLGGDGLARGYLNRPDLTEERFVANPFRRGTRLYKTGDLARWSATGQMEFLGRADHQVKVGGARVELAEVEAHLAQHPGIRECVVGVVPARRDPSPAEPRYCARCGVASNVPGVSYGEDGVCNLCRSYESYKERAQAYFKSMDELRRVFDEMRTSRTGDYDCLALYSGGKDSTYMVAQLAAAGLKVLAFTLDNGYISEEAKDNIRRVTSTLGMEHVFGTTPAMNRIFVESLNEYANVCNGCFKTIYTLAVNLAREKDIRHIVTGLSRGQFFETRLSMRVLSQPNVSAEGIDNAVLEARKAYHRRADVISRELDVDAFRSESLFEDIQFVDFYRYCDVSLEELYAFLDQHLPWVRPRDTGRSTNCLINDLGIYVHKKQRGYHNYALPYSWDVRLGHKQRDAALEELNDRIDPAAVRRIMREIGYSEPEEDDDPSGWRLAGYYVSDSVLSVSELRSYLAQRLPDFMIPTFFVRLASMPLTRNGKVDRAALPDPRLTRSDVASAYVAPRTPLEAGLAEIWSAALNIARVGIHDNFFDLGGSSLPAIQVIYEVNQRYRIDVPIKRLFECPTIAAMGRVIEELLIARLDELTDEEALRLFAHAG